MRIILIFTLLFAVWYFYQSDNTSSEQNTQPAFSDWPPVVNQQYPDLPVIDHRGQSHKLSDFFGKVLLIEPIGMTCAACNAFSGADTAGGFQGVNPQKNLESIETYLPQFADGIQLDDDRIIFIQLLLYDMKMQAPSQADAQLWAEHFRLNDRPNAYVVVPDRDMRSDASYRLIPGFQLVDKRGILRRDGSGHKKTHDLWRETLPYIPTLLKETI